MHRGHNCIYSMFYARAHLSVYDKSSLFLLVYDKRVPRGLVQKNLGGFHCSLRVSQIPGVCLLQNYDKKTNIFLILKIPQDKI